MRDIAWLVVGFYGLLRRSEIIALQRSDLSEQLAGHRGWSNVQLLEHGSSVPQQLSPEQRAGPSRPARACLSELRQRYPHIALNPNSYGMHSLRRGGTVAAWAGGMDVEKLKAHGRWRSDAIKASMTASLDIKLSVTLSM